MIDLDTPMGTCGQKRLEVMPLSYKDIIFTIRVHRAYNDYTGMVRLVLLLTVTCIKVVIGSYSSETIYNKIEYIRKYIKYNIK